MSKESTTFDFTTLRNKLHQAIEYGQVEGVKVMLKECKKQGMSLSDSKLIDPKNGDPILHALFTSNRKPEIIQAIIDIEGDPSLIWTINRSGQDGYPNVSPLHYAIKYNKEPEVQVMIKIAKQNSRVIEELTDAQGRTPLEFAIECKVSPSIIKTLMSAQGISSVGLASPTTSKSPVPQKQTPGLGYMK